MKIGGRLAGCFAAIFLIMVALCLFTVNRLRYINGRIDDMTEEKWQSSVTSRGAGETASASAQLAADARVLQSLVQRFKLVA